tara:strand:+ start:5005 stop:6843 length:1839 start_codon:yes stop_codon:yes gene_type:complete
MSTKKLIVEVEVQNAPDVQKQMSGIEDSLKKIAEQNVALMKTSREAASVVTEAYERLNKQQEDRQKGHARSQAQASEEVKSSKKRSSALSDEEKAVKQLNKARRDQHVGMTQAIRAGTALVHSGTQLIRMYALMTAANEKEAEAMLRRIAYFESWVQGIQGVASAYRNLIMLREALNKIQASGALTDGLSMMLGEGAVAGQVGRGTRMGRMVGRGWGMLKNYATPLAVGAAGAYGVYKAWDHAGYYGGGSVFGNVGLGRGGLPTGTRGIKDEGILADPMAMDFSFQNQIDAMYGVGETGRLMSDPRWSDHAKRREVIAEEQSRRNALRTAIAKAESRGQQYGAMGMQTQVLGNIAGAEYVGEEQSERFFGLRRKALRKQFDLGETMTQSMFGGVSTGGPQAAENMNNMLQSQFEVVNQLAAETARVEQKKYQNQLDNLSNVINAEKEAYNIQLERLGKLRETHQAEMSGAQRFLSMDPLQRQQAMQAGQRVMAGTATESDLQLTRGLFATDAGRQRQQEGELRAAGAAGYFDSVFVDPGSSLEKAVNRLKEIGRLEMNIDTSGEQIVKLEGQFADLSKDIGEKVAKAVQEKWQDTIDSLLAQIEQINIKINQ